MTPEQIDTAFRLVERLFDLFEKALTLAERAATPAHTVHRTGGGITHITPVSSQ